jgi:uroporphyrinogen decarboxylase
VDATDIKAIIAGYHPQVDLTVMPKIRHWQGTLTPRERFNRVMNFQPVDRIPNYEFGYWAENYAVWQSQGMSKAVINEERANMYFGFDEHMQFGVNFGLHPAFPTQVLRTTPDGHKIIVDGDGVTCEVFDDNASSIPHYLDWSLKTPDDWSRFKDRLNADDPDRIPANWQQQMRKLKSRTVPAGIYFGSLPGWVRNWMGFEGICMAVHDYPEMMEDIFHRMTDVIVKQLERALPGTDFDYAYGWEDISFRSGPILSPDYFRSVIVPCYKRITEVLRRHGIKTIYTDSDGDISLLIEPFLEGGITALFPLERAGLTDPVEIRKRYGKRVRMLGGVDKVPLLEGPAAIKRELERLAPVVEEGGYIPHMDHRVPPDISYENYLYYLDVKHQLFGIPKSVS